MDYFSVNGRVVSAAEASISVLDLGFLRGVGAFETFRTYGGGHPHALKEHLQRIWESGEAIGLTPFFNETDVRRLVAELRKRGGHEEMRVNLIITPGSHTSGVFGADTPTWVMIARDLHAPSEDMYQRGVTAVTFAATRHLPSLKTTNYLSGKTGMMLAEKSGAHEALYVDPDGYVTEGVTSNVLIIKGKRLMTPSIDCLPGITKAGIKPIAESVGLEWYECRLTRDDIYLADEVWITSAVRELLPVVAVDGKRVHDGLCGQWAQRIRPLYHARCVADARRDAGLA